MITKSAIKFKGKIYTAKRHSYIIKGLKEGGIITMDDKPLLQDQGFVNMKGEFLTRYQAKFEAIKSGQIPPEFEGLLHSEDLW